MNQSRETPKEPDTPFFVDGDEFGEIRGSGDLLSRLTIRYPRKLGRPLEFLFDLRLAAAGIPGLLRRKAAMFPPKRKVLIVGVELPERFRAELSQSRHDVTIATKHRQAGLFRSDNLNILLSGFTLDEFDWLVISDDDVEIPPNFLDRFLFLVEHFDFKLAQPAHKLLSHASFEVTRRHFGTLARRTQYVEIGPLMAMHRDVFRFLLPLPGGGMGWGIDVYWSSLARKHGWAEGIIDALPIRHTRPIAASYSATAAREEARRFLADNGGMLRRDALRTLARHRAL